MKFTINLIEHPHLTGSLIVMEDLYMVHEDNIRYSVKHTFQKEYPASVSESLETMNDEGEAIVKEILNLAVQDRVTHAHSIMVQRWTDREHGFLTLILRGVRAPEVEKKQQDSTLTLDETNKIIPPKSEKIAQEALERIREHVDPGPAYGGDIGRPPCPPRPDAK